MDYGRAIRTCRAALGWQQKELAAKAQLSPSHLSLIESGERNPGPELAERLGQAMGIPLYLLYLLAAEPQDLRRRPQEEVERLSRLLLEVLISAGRANGDSGQA